MIIQKKNNKQNQFPQVWCACLHDDFNAKKQVAVTYVRPNFSGHRKKYEEISKRIKKSIELKILRLNITKFDNDRESHNPTCIGP